MNCVYERADSGGLQARRKSDSRSMIRGTGQRNTGGRIVEVMGEGGGVRGMRCKRKGWRKGRKEADGGWTRIMGVGNWRGYEGSRGGGWGVWVKREGRREIG